MTPWQNAIDKELRWRKAELAALRLTLFENNPPDGEAQSTLFKTLLRASWAMLYAHYEGFTIFLFSEYLDRIERMNIARKHCVPPVQVASLRHHLPKVRNLSEADFVAFLREGFLSKIDEPIEFPRNTKRKDEFELKGRSNMWPWLLHDCCEQHGIPLAAFDRSDVRLRLLVGRRNDIAHGRDTPVKDFVEFDEYYHHILALLDQLSDMFSAAVSKCLYLDPAIKHQETAKVAYHLWLTSGGDATANWLEAESRIASSRRP